MVTTISSEKILQTIIWIANSVNTSYVLKTEYEFYVHIRKFLNDLEVRRSSGVHLYWGRLLIRNLLIVIPPNCFAKSLIDFSAEERSCHIHWVHADIISKVAHNACLIQLYTNEDVSVSVWVSPFKLERKDDDHFNINHGPCQSNSCIPEVNVYLRNELYANEKCLEDTSS